HQRKSREPPFDGRELGEGARLAGIAQQGHVRHEGLRVEADPGFPQCAAQLGDERFELGGNDRSAGPGDAVLLPVAGPVEHERCGLRRDPVRSPLDFRNLRIFHAAEKSERHMQLLGRHDPAAAQRVELARPAREPGAHRVVGPQREEQPHGSKPGTDHGFVAWETMKPVVCPRFYSSSAIASAAMPSPRPIAPRRSEVFALTLTWSGRIARSAARFATIVGMCSAIFGASARMVASTLAIENPASRILPPTSRRKVRLSAFLYFGSLSGKCRPMSPSAAAPRSASHTAWTSTSASECPARPFSNGMFTPPRMSFRPFTSACTSYPWPILTAGP